MFLFLHACAILSLLHAAFQHIVTVLFWVPLIVICVTPVKSVGTVEWVFSFGAFLAHRSATAAFCAVIPIFSLCSSRLVLSTKYALCPTSYFERMSRETVTDEQFHRCVLVVSLPSSIFTLSALMINRLELIYGWGAPSANMLQSELMYASLKLGLPLHKMSLHVTSNEDKLNLFLRDPPKPATVDAKAAQDSAVPDSTASAASSNDTPLSMCGALLCFRSQVTLSLVSFLSLQGRNAMHEASA